MSSVKLALSDFSFSELFTAEGLAKLDQQFLDELRQQHPDLLTRLLDYRQGKISNAMQISQWIIDCAPVLETFLTALFGIENDVAAQRQQVQRDNVIFSFKKHFVLREAKRALKTAESLAPFSELDQWLSSQVNSDDDKELAVAEYAASLLAEPQRYAMQIQQLVDWCVQAMASDAGQLAVKDWVSFHFPKRLDYDNLVATERQHERLLQTPTANLRQREGFKLTDQRMSQREVLDEVHYCVYCHDKDGDFCSKGFPVKKRQPEQGLKINPLGEVLTGCPLEEKISEMHYLKKTGYNLAALAVIMIDNPLCPATGHRICNDCMKACIYQKQEPVNIPQIETGVLTDVLSLPWGVELYDLLVRWNPLRQTQYLAKPYNEKKILVMGMGPAGFTLAHHLLMEGFAVVGADGLKIEPLPDAYLNQPIYRYQDIVEALDERIMTGFGGVAEYGITVRWDKNFLKLIYISLMRRPFFQVFGSVRFGGTLQVEDAWKLGFDHLAIAVGAGLPRELAIPNSLAPGMRQANDFLMALQLTGAARASSLANLQLRLPAVVIGGGLTGIDTATEVQAYYIAQIEKVASRYAILCDAYGESELRARFDKTSLTIIDEFLQHAAMLKSARQQAKAAGAEVDFIALLRQWGGVTVVYRRRLQDSPAYQRNHEEVAKAMEEGVYYAECLSPEAVLLDDSGHVSALKCRQRQYQDGEWQDTDNHKTLPARAIFVATGARPNIAYEYEHRGTFLREADNYQRFDENDNPVTAKSHCKTPDFGAFTSYRDHDHRVSFLGDTHPVFHGSVVKAIASAKQVYPFITKQVLKNHSTRDESYANFSARMTRLFEARVVAVKRRSDGLLELIVNAPLAASHYQPGAFYRVQNYETGAQRLGDTVLQTEAMAMLAAPVDNEPDLLSFWVLERGVSSRLVASFKVGEPLAVMGPTGAKFTFGDRKETLMIMGGMMALAQLRSVAALLRAQGHKVWFAACFEQQKLQAHRNLIEVLSDEVLWLGDNWVASLAELNHLSAVDRVVAVGSADFIHDLQAARRSLLQDCFAATTKFSGSVYGAMQCMLKGVCAQCLQWQIDPATGKHSKAVYACSWQQQPLEGIDSHNIAQRLSQNSASEQLSDAWLDYLFDKCDIIKV